MIEKFAKTYTVNVYIAGPIDVAKQVIRDECKKKGLCVTITPTTYIYTMGEESGYVVGFINYPRFESENEDTYNRAKEIGIRLMNETFQGSFTIVATDKSEFVSIREVDILE